jgi:hypothetical protein
VDDAILEGGGAGGSSSSGRGERAPLFGGARSDGEGAGRGGGGSLLSSLIRNK